MGVDCIDIIVLCRVPQDVPIEETVKAMQQMVTEGKAKHIGLSEVCGRRMGCWECVLVVRQKERKKERKRERERERERVRVNTDGWIGILQ